MIQYFADLIYGSTKHAFGGLRLRVVLGYFSSCEHGRYQKIFFDELRAQEFKRTIWQLVFPGQTAGLIKKIPKQSNGANEYHIRFYDDGTIDCELEVARFDILHWTGSRQNDKDLLVELLNNSVSLTCDETKERIKKLFGTKPYSANCLRSNELA